MTHDQYLDAFHEQANKTLTKVNQLLGGSTANLEGAKAVLEAHQSAVDALWDQYRESAAQLVNP
jgi:hypothetical protein